MVSDLHLTAQRLLAHVYASVADMKCSMFNARETFAHIYFNYFKTIVFYLVLFFVGVVFYPFLFRYNK